MAEEKTGNDASSQKPNKVSQTGVPGKPGTPVPSPAHPPVSHLMPHDGAVSAEPVIHESVIAPTAIPVPDIMVPQKKAERASIPEVQKKAPAKPAPPVLPPMPSPSKPPVSHLMPHAEIVPTQPLITPPKPPVTSVMPPTPSTTIELTTPPPPVFTGVAMQEPEPPAPVVMPTGRSAPVQDALEAEVGLTKPAPKTRPPEPQHSDMDKILKGIKLPEKRAYAPAGEYRAPAPTIEPDAQKLDEILAAQITENTPASVPATAPVQNTVPDQKVFHEDLHVASVHTLKQDLQHVVQEQRMSVVKAVALEQEKRSRFDHTEEIPRPPSKAPAVLFTIAVFILLGLGALGGVYYIATIQSAPGPVSENTSLVFAEQTVAFALTQDSPQSLRSQLATNRNTSGTLGSLLHIVPVVPHFDESGKEGGRPATLAEFFKAIGTEPPENLMRALGDDFFLGIHTVDKNAPILVIKVTSYDRAFDGMLSWEKSMNADLTPLFAVVPRLIMGTDGLQTERPFTDLVMRNYDVRALKDDDGVIQLYYSFPTRDLLIIAESPYTFTEILSRLQAGRRL